jgi:2-polyprenyl-3-methyl-5-hydroxy-6-metoxy-1,4-benzoquinol methylase
MQKKEYFGHPRTEMLPFVPADAHRILDIGCGAGAFAAGIKATRGDDGADPEIWGVEMNAQAAARAGEILDRVLVGDALAVLPDLAGQLFDCVVMNDVLEHVAEPAELLTAVLPFLAPGGRLVASIPNVRYFFNVLDLVWYGRWDYTDEGILDRTHLRFFTRSSIIKLLQECGFSVDTMQGINPTGSLKFKLANLSSLGRYSDMRYLQFAVVARAAGDRQDMAR